MEYSPYKVKEICEKCNISIPKLGEYLGIHVSSPRNWNYKHEGRIPASYTEKIEKLLQKGGEIAIKKEEEVTKALKKTHKVEVIEPAKPSSSSPMVALVGNPGDVLAVLKELRITKE